MMLWRECYFEGSQVPSQYRICWVSPLISLYLLVSRNKCTRWKANQCAVAQNQGCLLEALTLWWQQFGRICFAQWNPQCYPRFGRARADPAGDHSTVGNGIRITALACFVSFGFNLQFRTILFDCTSFIWISDLRSKRSCCVTSH